MNPLKMMNRPVFLALVAILTAPVAMAQIASLGSDTHQIISARAAALGDSYSSDAFDAMIMYWNPAGLTHLRRQSLSVNSAIEQDDFDDRLITENVTLPIPVVQDWGLGVGLTSTSVGSIPAGSPLQGLNFSIFRFDIAASTAVSPFISIGAGATVRLGSGGGRSITAFSGSIGAIYSPNAVVSYSLAAQGFGDGVDFGVDENQHTLLNKSNLPRSVVAGLLARTPEKSIAQFTLTAEGEKIVNESGIVYKGGIEGLATPFLALRLGYWVGPNTRAARYGAGLILGDFMLDYAIAPSRLEPRYQQFSLSYNLQRRTGKN
ncbi:MAG TPA: hypothetical protein VL126_16725 [Bacteroidota bacterium]|nr:hypothetical protein [Bacteroidota bacterium]